MRSRIPVIRSIFVFLAFTVLLQASVAAQSTEMVSVDSTGVQGDRYSHEHSISADGRFIAFTSGATNLVSGDTNGADDIFVHDRLTGSTTRVSVDSADIQGNNTSRHPSISADGRYIAFTSAASNLVTGDTNLTDDVFVRDRQAGQTIRASLDSAGLQGDGHSATPSISADGNFVAFISGASNLVPGDSNAHFDIFVHDIRAAQTTRASIDSLGSQADGDSGNPPAISAEGRYVAFGSGATNLVSGDTNGWYDVFVHDRQTGQTTRVSVDSAGTQTNFDDSVSPSISADGRLVAFYSYATNLVPGDTNGCSDVFVHDSLTGQTTRVSKDSSGVQGKRYSQYAHISADGRYVSFFSKSNNLVPGDTNRVGDIFVHDRQTGHTTRVSVDTAGAQADGYSEESSITADGRLIAFYSNARNLVPSDTNGAYDVFVHDRGEFPSLAQIGACPGAITLSISNATTSGLVALLYGPVGVFVNPLPPCQGLSLGILPPTLGTIVSANGSGTALLNFNAVTGACGLSVQAVDITTCTATNVIAL